MDFAKSKTVNFEIDNFDKVGTVWITARTKPLSRGQNSEEVFSGWVSSNTFSFSLKANQRFPISVRGHRYPREIGNVISRETREKLDHDDKATWDTESLIRGSKACQLNGFCIHEERGQEKCPPSVELGNGVIRNNDEVWVMRMDGPPVHKSKLIQKRKDEIEERKIINAKAEALLQSAQPVHQRTSPTVQRAPVAAPKGPIGGKGLVEAAES